MREEMNKYLEMLGEDEEAQNKLRDFNTDDQESVITASIEIAKGYGIELVREDFDLETSELDEDELKAVSGGLTMCVCPGAGAGASGDGYYGGCGCCVGGAGQFYRDKKHKEKAGFCRCIFVGGGGA